VQVDKRSQAAQHRVMPNQPHDELQTNLLLLQVGPIVIASDCNLKQTQELLSFVSPSIATVKPV
jgi:hypothetical protein